MFYSQWPGLGPSMGRCDCCWRFPVKAIGGGFPRSSVGEMGEASDRFYPLLALLAEPTTCAGRVLPWQIGISPTHASATPVCLDPPVDEVTSATRLLLHVNSNAFLRY